MVRFSNIILAYVVVGTVMFGAGAVTYDNVGPTSFFVDQSADGFEESDAPTSELDGVGQTISSVISQFGGPLIIVWNIFVTFIIWLHWPVSILLEVNAPPRLVLLLGVPMVAAFYLSIIRLVKSSA